MGEDINDIKLEIEIKKSKIKNYLILIINLQ
jgi:hypothetical protein